jgi:hypothetical protein
MVQTAVADPVLREGQIFNGPWPQKILSRIAEDDIGFGRLVDYGTDPETQVQEIPALPVADVDAIMTAAALASAAAAQDIASGNFDGVIGRDRISPCRCITVTFDADAGWDTVSGECRIDIYGTDASGASIVDTVAKANGSGAVTLTTRKAFAQVDRVHVEACNAATGTATMGVSNDVVELTQRDYPGVAAFYKMKEPNDTTTPVYEIAQYDDVDVLQEGRIVVVVEHAVSVGDQAYVRVLAAGNDVRGQFTGQDGADTPATYAKLAGGSFMTAAAADGLAVLELRGV